MRDDKRDTNGHVFRSKSCEIPARIFLLILALNVRHCGIAYLQRIQFSSHVAIGRGW